LIYYKVRFRIVAGDEIMKDKELREELGMDGTWRRGSLWDRIEGSIEVTDRLKGISIKDCPKCKHPALVGDRTLFLEHPKYKKGYFQCLTCGSKLTCSERSVCEVIKED